MAKISEKPMSAAEIREALATLEQTREALIGQMTSMSAEDRIKMLAEAQPKVLPGTKEMEALLQAGYPDMSVEKAKRVIKERQENPHLWPYEVVERAEAFLAAYNAKPVVTQTRAGWKRTRAD